MSKITYLFTGLSSQLGKSYLRYLQETNPSAKIVGIVSGTKTKEEYDKLKTINGNLEIVMGRKGEKGLLEPLLSFFQPDVVGNFGALTSVYGSDDQVIEYTNANLLTSIELMEAIKKMPDSSRPILINISSSEMYGALNIESANEYMCPSPTNAYGASKAALTIYSNLYSSCYGVPVINMITSNFISEFCSEKFIVGKVLNYLFNNKLEKLQLGNLDSVRDWMYVDDLINAIELLIKLKKYGSFCISSGNICTVNSLIKELFLAYGINNYKDYIIVDNSLVRKLDHFIKIDSSYLQLLGWTSQYKLTEIVNKIIERKKLWSIF